MMHPHTACKMVNEIVGLGVFATQDIPKGTITWVNDGLDIRIEKKALEKLPSVCQDYIEKYSYVKDPSEDCIINWDHARYMNHCCFSNTLCTAYNFDVAIVDIKKNEQITCDYRMFDPCDSEMLLSCQKKNCLKQLKKQKLRPIIDVWDKKIQDALYELRKLPQQLLDIVPAEDLEDLDNFIKNKKPYRSILLSIEYLCR